jgi:hypothetical protein
MTMPSVHFFIYRMSGCAVSQIMDLFHHIRLLFSD